MDLQLHGKKALVTGSTAGIGLAIATTLAREGADVTLNGRTETRVAEAVYKVRVHAKGSVSGIAADAGTRPGTDQLIARLPEVDVLVNNLGIVEPHHSTRRPRPRRLTLDVTFDGADDALLQSCGQRFNQALLNRPGPGHFGAGLIEIPCCQHGG